MEDEKPMSEISQTMIQLDKPNQNLWRSQRKNSLGTLATTGLGVQESYFFAEEAIEGAVSWRFAASQYSSICVKDKSARRWPSAAVAPSRY